MREKYCRICGCELPDNADFCPSCGAPVNAQPKNVNALQPAAAKKKAKFYETPWFYICLGIIVLIFLYPSRNNARVSSSQERTMVERTTPTPIVYTQYELPTLFDELSENALRAKENHQGEYVEIVGYIHNFDNDGKYISIGMPEDNYSYFFQTIMCYIKTDEQKQILMSMSKYDEVTIRGKIRNIGEVMGYSLDIDSIG